MMTDLTDGAQLVERLGRALMRPLLATLEVSDRVFLPFLLGAAGMAALVWARKLRGKVTLRQFLFPRSIWLHQSALFDLRWMAVRALLSLLLLFPFVVSTSVVFLRSALFLKHQLGAGPLSSITKLAPGCALVGVSLIAFVGEDFVRYFTHRLMHRVPALWQLHQLHHSAEVLTPFSVYRTHPLEGILMQTSAAVALGVSAAFGAWLFDSRLAVAQLFGVLAPSFVWNLLGANLRHSHVWMAYPSWLAKVLLSPASHQIHHSKLPAHHDRNFGSVFSFWDRLFGSYWSVSKRQELSFGIEPQELNHELNLGSALLGPLRAAVSVGLKGLRRDQSASVSAPAPTPLKR